MLTPGRNGDAVVRAWYVPSSNTRHVMPELFKVLAIITVGWLGTASGWLVCGGSGCLVEMQCHAPKVSSLLGDDVNRL